MSKRGRPGRTIPAGLDPAVEFVLRAIHDRDTDQHAIWRVEAGAGLGIDTVRMWHYASMKRGPMIRNVRAALNEIGYDLAVVPLARERELR